MFAPIGCLLLPAAVHLGEDHRTDERGVVPIPSRADKATERLHPG